MRYDNVMCIPVMQTIELCRVRLKFAGRWRYQLKFVVTVRDGHMYSNWTDCYQSGNNKG